MFRPRGPASRRTWTPELAYAMGVLATDGNLSPDGRHICFVSTNRDHLEVIGRILGLTNRITHHSSGSYGGGPAYRLTFGDRLFYEWSVSIGIGPRKTKVIGPVDVPDHLFRDFVRGHLDGDGSIVTYIDRYNTRLKPAYIYRRLYVRFISASQVHMEWMSEKIKGLAGISGYLNVESIRPGRTVRLSRLAFAKKGAIRLLHWIYYNPQVPCLRRKYLLAEPFLRAAADSAFWLPGR